MQRAKQVWSFSHMAAQHEYDFNGLLTADRGAATMVRPATHFDKADQ